MPACMPARPYARRTQESSADLAALMRGLRGDPACDAIITLLLGLLRACSRVLRGARARRASASPLVAAHGVCWATLLVRAASCSLLCCSVAYRGLTRAARGCADRQRHVRALRLAEGVPRCGVHEGTSCPALLSSQPAETAGSRAPRSCCATTRAAAALCALPRACCGGASLARPTPADMT